MKLLPLLLLLAAPLAAPLAARADIIVAEGEKFTPKEAGGWGATHQQDSYGSHTYGGMWMSQGGCLGAKADAVGVTASHPISVAKAGKYRVWSKYQAPPYFNYLHKLEVVQNGKAVFSHTFGKKGTDRLWSFSGESDELWWPWGVDHDAAEGAPGTVDLAAGPAELRLTAVANPKPAGDRFIDFILLTTEPGNTYQGFKPMGVGSPFLFEALAATPLYVRFKNAAAAPGQMTVTRAGHFQPNYGSATTKIPAQPVAAGAWSAWENIGPFCRLVHDEGLTLNLPGAKEFAVQFARDAAGAQVVGDFTAADGGTAVVPIDITWNAKSRVKTAKEHATALLADSKNWRKANGGQKAKDILFYGAFNGPEGWVFDLKSAMGYNTVLPAKYPQAHVSNLHAHAGSLAEITAFAKQLKEKDRLRVLSFGDEISLGRINFQDPKLQAKFRAWLAAKGVTKADLGVDPAAAALAETGDGRLVWYSNLFNEEERFADYRAMTELAKKEIGPHVLTGANYSPHHLALFYGPVFQWVDIFKHAGMGMMWAEDYVFSVPEVPQIASWQMAQVRCGVKYHKQPIHMYIMPHAPGQEPGFLRRGMLLSVGYGARHIDNFWVAPAERFTENYVGWTYPETFRTLSEAIYDTAEVEKIQVGGTVRPPRVAVVTGKANDFNESRLMVPKEKDVFAKDSKNAPAQLNQIIGRKDQQMLYLSVLNAGHAADVITEDDIVDLGILKNYDVVYFAGEWADHRTIPLFTTWVEAGGTLYATAGCGNLNEFNAPEPAMLKLLGLKGISTQKDVAVIRTLLELPLLPAIGTITLDGAKIPAVGMKQTLFPDTAKTIGTWDLGEAAVTVNAIGKGKVFAVGTLAGNSWMKTGLRQIPYARGGRHTVYNPTEFSEAATKLVRLALDDKKPAQAAACSATGVETAVIDGPAGTLLTVVNWTNEPVKAATWAVKLPFAPTDVRSVKLQKKIDATYKDGTLTFVLDVDDADYVTVRK